MKPIAWIRPCESEGAVLEWDRPHSSDCADPTHLYHGSEVDARIAALKAEVAAYKAPLEQFIAQWESDIQFYNGLDGHDLATWADLFRAAITRSTP